MYLPQAFAEPRIAVMGRLMRDYPLASVVTCGANGLVANPIPLEWSAEPAPWGSLRGHAARTNPFWQDCPSDTEVLAIFHGPDAYISPSWYLNSKESRQVVPTWNYVAVHAYGYLRVHEDGEWLLAQLDSQTQRQEAAFAQPWKLTDAAADFIDSLLPSIIGIEIIITRLEGKWKTSQNRSPADREGVATGLRKTGISEAFAMAELVKPGK